MKSIQTMYLCVCMFAKVVCMPVCACTHTYTYESIHTSLFRIVIIELHMCTAKCSVRVVKHEPIASQRVRFQMLFSGCVAVQKSP